MLLVNQTFLKNTDACMRATEICAVNGPLCARDMVNKFIASVEFEPEFGIVYWVAKYMKLDYWYDTRDSLIRCESLTKKEQRELCIHAVNVVLRKYYANEAASINRSVRNL